MMKANHCPGFEQFRYLKSFSFKCPFCQNMEEIFSNEIEKHMCSGCKKKIDFTYYIQSEDPNQFDNNRTLLK